VVFVVANSYRRPLFNPGGFNAFKFLSKSEDLSVSHHDMAGGRHMSCKAVSERTVQNNRRSVQ
jgi:hypothetical protein